MIKASFALIALLALPVVARASAVEVPYSVPGHYNPTTYTFTADATGDLTGYFVSKGTAIYNDRIGVLVDGTLSSQGFGLDNQTSQFGESFNFGEVKKGDSLVFELQDLTLGQSAYSDASRNAAYDGSNDTEGHNHIYSETYAGGVIDGVTIPRATYVAFEDEAFPDSDFNYNDDSFVFTNTASQAVSAAPEPSTWLLMIAGIGGIGLMLRQAKKTLGFRLRDALSA